MITKKNPGLGLRQEWTAWMEIANPDLSVDDAVKKLKDLGNNILEVDKKNRRIKVLHEVSE